MPDATTERTRLAKVLRLTQDARGNWRRQNLGVYRAADGGVKKTTFSLGKDFDAACQRSILIARMWEAIQKEWHREPKGYGPSWTGPTHRLALAVARGENPIFIGFPPEMENHKPGQRDEHMAMWYGLSREMFPFLDIRPASEEDRESAERGVESLVASVQREVEAAATASRAVGRSVGGLLHAALEDFNRHLASKCSAGQARTQANNVKLLKGHLDDESLSLITADRIEAVLSYFAKRPLSKHTDRPLAFHTCRNVLIAFRRFLRWLHRSEAYGWELPRAFQFPRVKITKLPSDRVKKRRYFTRSELEILWQYALPWDRALMALALNCGFSKAEIATLQTAEVVRAKGQTFISRERVKTDAYGRWLLWEETLAALAYLKGLRRDDTPFAVVSKTGKPLNRLTRGGNENQTIKNHWDRLLKRVKADYPDFHTLPFKCLRKTGANLVRRIAKNRATELASMYLAHSERSDSPDTLLHHYTDRPWGLLHKTLRRLRRKLNKMFSTVADPWKPQRHTVSPLTRSRIRALRAEGWTQEAIAKEVGLHPVTVGRYCRMEADSAGSTEKIA
jgi:hypothetical protein